MCLTAAKRDRALLPRRTFCLSLMSPRTRLWNACVLWALQDQSQLSSSTACALTEAYAYCHGFCKNQAFLLMPWPGLNMNWSLHCAAEKLSQSQHDENTAGHLAPADVVSHQNFANSKPITEGVPSTLQLRTEEESMPRLSCTHPHQAETKPVLLTNRFICILTGAQILDTDFFCTTVQEPVQNMLFF